MLLAMPRYAMAIFSLLLFFCYILRCHYYFSLPLLLFRYCCWPLMIFSFRLSAAPCRFHCHFNIMPCRHFSIFFFFIRFAAAMLLMLTLHTLFALCRYFRRYAIFAAVAFSFYFFFFSYVITADFIRYLPLFARDIRRQTPDSYFDFRHCLRCCLIFRHADLLPLCLPH